MQSWFSPEPLPLDHSNGAVAVSSSQALHRQDVGGKDQQDDCKRGAAPEPEVVRRYSSAAGVIEELAPDVKQGSHGVPPDLDNRASETLSVLP